VYSDKVAWKHLVQQGMKRDFSWERSAGEYVAVYRKAMRKR
jgi:starch synthase